MITKEDKLYLISHHKKTLFSRKYSLELDLLQENAVTTPSTSTVNGLNTQINNVIAQIAALDAEEASVNAE